VLRLCNIHQQDEAKHQETADRVTKNKSRTNTPTEKDRKVGGEVMIAGRAELKNATCRSL
jgi:hypothetical protein